MNNPDIDLTANSESRVISFLEECRLVAEMRNAKMVHCLMIMHDGRVFVGTSDNAPLKEVGA